MLDLSDAAKNKFNNLEDTTPPGGKDVFSAYIVLIRHFLTYTQKNPSYSEFGGLWEAAFKQEIKGTGWGEAPTEKSIFGTTGKDGWRKVLEQKDFIIPILFEAFVYYLVASNIMSHLDNYINITPTLSICDLIDYFNGKIRKFYTDYQSYVRSIYHGTNTTYRNQTYFASSFSLPPPDIRTMLNKMKIFIYGVWAYRGPGDCKAEHPRWGNGDGAPGGRYNFNSYNEAGELCSPRGSGRTNCPYNCGVAGWADHRGGLFYWGARRGDIFKNWADVTWSMISNIEPIILNWNEETGLSILSRFCSTTEAAVNTSVVKTSVVENTSTINTSIENTSLKNTVVENTSLKNTVVENTAAENTATINTSPENTSAENTAAENTAENTAAVDDSVTLSNIESDEEVMARAEQLRRSYEDIFEFNEEIYLKDFMGNFDEGINTFNENIDTLRIKQREFDDNSNKIKKRINNNHKKNTYERGSYLLTEKINFYDYWIDMLYGTHKIMIVILCIIVVIMLIYKLMNKSN
jgi:hypothetical protein